MCSERICESRRVRVLADDKYVCCDADFWRRCNIVDDDDPKVTFMSSFTLALLEKRFAHDLRQDPLQMWTSLGLCCEVFECVFAVAATGLLYYATNRSRRFGRRSREQQENLATDRTRMLQYCALG